jgi:hypothetical protein
MSQHPELDNPELLEAAKVAADALHRVSELVGCDVSIGFFPADDCFVSDRFTFRVGGISHYRGGVGSGADIADAIPKAFDERASLIAHFAASSSYDRRAAPYPVYAEGGA